MTSQTPPACTPCLGPGEEPTHPFVIRGPREMLDDLQREITRIVLTSSTPAEAIPRFVKAAATDLDWDCAAYWAVDRADQRLCCIHLYQSTAVAEDLPCLLRADVDLCQPIGMLGRAAAYGEPAWLTAVPASPPASASASVRAVAAAAHGIRSALWLPVASRSQVTGVLELFSLRTRPANAELLHSLLVVGTMMGQFIVHCQTESALSFQSSHDRLTALPNREEILARLQRSVAAAQANRSSVALLLFELNGFKAVNDTLGHAYGDQVLCEAAARVRSALHPDAMLGRLSGDEYAVMIANADLATAVKHARTILARLEMPYALAGHSVEVGASLGIALYPDHACDAHELLRRADVAMDAAKDGKGGYEIYSAAKDNHTVTRLTLACDLRQALAQEQLRAYYQPMLTMPQGAFVRAEVLVRWQHPLRGLIMPEQFIPVAEATGLIGVLTLWVLESALRQSRIWSGAGYDLGLSVNISARTLQDVQLPDTVAWLLQRYGVAPGRLTLEITESTLMVDPARALGVLDRLAQIGVRIAIDDFGTGYSSLAYLKGLPVHEIKIDKSFVLGMTTSAKDTAIVRSVIELGHNLGLEVVAEGVEHQESWHALMVLGCDVAQGNLLGLPVPASELASRVAARV